MAINDEELRAKLRAEIADVGSQRLWAERAGLSESYVSEVLRGTRSPGEKVLRALGVTRRIVYEREGSPGGSEIGA